MSSPLTDELIKAFNEEFKHFRDTVKTERKQRFDAALADMAHNLTPLIASPNEEIRRKAIVNMKVIRTELLALAVITEVEAAERINAAVSRAIGILTKAALAAI